LQLISAVTVVEGVGLGEELGEAVGVGDGRTGMPVEETFTVEPSPPLEPPETDLPQALRERALKTSTKVKKHEMGFLKVFIQTIKQGPSQEAPREESACDQRLRIYFRN
jgi:hypothetical protein